MPAGPVVQRIEHAVDVPVMAHEGCFSLTNFTALVELGAVRVLGVNSERPGGIPQALRAIDYAACRGMGTVLHNQPLGIASAAQAHLGAARAHVLGHAMELFGNVMLGPGYGVVLDEAAVARYATARPVVLDR